MLGRVVSRIGVRGRLGTGSVRAIASAAAALAVLTTIIGAGWSNGHPADKVRLLSGAAWLPSSPVGQLTLLDGSSAEIAAQVKVAPPGNRLDTVQSGTTAYAINRTAGSIRRIDGGTFEPTAPVTPIPDAGEGLQAYASADALYALDTQRGVLTQTDPRTLASRSGLSPLVAQASAQAATVDDTGRLWVLDTATGDLTWIKDGQRDTRRQVTQPDSGMLVLAGGSPVLVDTRARTASILDSGSGDTENTTQLDLRPDDTIWVGGSPLTPRLYVVASRGILAVCDLTGTSCGDAVPLSNAGPELGPPIETGDRVFVPDYTSGRVWIVDLKEKRVVAQPQVLSPAGRFQLLTRDGIVFFNDPDSERAGVISLDGGVIHVPKYDPKNPDKGLTTTQPTAGNAPPTPPTASTEPTTTNTPSPKTAPLPLPLPPGRQITTTPPPGQRTTPPQDPQRSPTPQPDPLHNIRIVISNSQPKVSEDVTLEVIAESGPEPTSARWTFGDGQESNQLRATHHWDNAQTYQVTVQARFADGQTAVSSAPIQVTRSSPTLFRLTINSPKGGTVTGGRFIQCPPTCTHDFEPNTSVTLTTQPDAGFEFTGWGGNGGCAGTGLNCSLVMDTDRTVFASFRPPAPPVTVPDVTGLTENSASQTMSSANLVPVFQRVPNNSVPAGMAFEQSPAAGTKVAPGSQVNMTVSTGKTQPVDLIARAPEASWSSGAGQLPFNGNDGDNRGFALIRPKNSFLLEDNSAPEYLEMHPEWVDNGWINGDYTLPNTIIEGDRFRATIGFMAVIEPPSAGDAKFVVIAIFGNGATLELSRTHDIGKDGIVIPLDVDLTPALGATKLRLRVEARGTAAQDWASWVTPRIEG